MKYISIKLISAYIRRGLTMDTYRFLDLFRIIFIISIIALLNGCGGSSGSGNASSESAPVFTISGTVSGDTQKGVTITLSGDNSGTATTDGNGNYSFSDLTDGSYTLTPYDPSIFWYTYSPISQSVTINGADVKGIDFTSFASDGFKYSISGFITVDGKAKKGVIVTLSGANFGTAATDDNGFYNFPGLVNNRFYTLTPSITEYAFTPSSQGVTINGADVGAINFTATNLSP
jgi:hypothetical protein